MGVESDRSEVTSEDSDGMVLVHAGSGGDLSDSVAGVGLSLWERRLMGAYTGRLKAARVPAASGEQFWRKRGTRRPSLKGFVLEEVPEATEYSDDDALNDPVEVVRLIKSFPELDKLLQESLSPYQDEIGPEPRKHRPRIKGRFDLLYAAWVCSKDPAMESFWGTWRSSKVWEECGFENGERPDYQVMRLRFIEFEQLERRGFREAGQRLIRNARKHDPLIGMFLMVDETRFDSVSLHEHCCPDPKDCKALWTAQQKKLGESGKGSRGPRQYLLRATDETYNTGKAIEVDGPELIEGELPATVVPTLGIKGRYLYREIDGHLYRTLDQTGGLRKYSVPRNESWHGGLMQAAVCTRYRTAIDYQAFAADQQPYDHLPELYDQLEQALGERPLAISGDGLYATKDSAEFLIRRGTQPVKPHTKRESPERVDMRCDVFDEHQVLRCPSCGSETEHEPYFVFQNGDPRVRVRCLTPGTERCYGWQSVRCEERWGWVGVLTYKDRVMNQLREKHGQMEGFWDSQRKRYRLAGKDTTGKIKRRAVVPAQQLRAEASLFIEWLRLSLRHGWIGSWKTRNENAPVPTDDKGRLAAVLRARAKRALQFPYGAQAVKLGLAKPPPDDDPPPQLAAASSAPAN